VVWGARIFFLMSLGFFIVLTPRGEKKKGKKEKGRLDPAQEKEKRKEGGYLFSSTPFRLFDMVGSEKRKRERRKEERNLH